MTNPRYGRAPDWSLYPVFGLDLRRDRIRWARFPMAFVKFLCALTLIGLAGIHAKAMADPRLKLNAVTRSEMVVIGDLFEDAGPAASFAAFSAPKPGQSVYVDTALVVAAASASGIEWQLPRGISRIRVTREGTPVPFDAIISAIHEEFLRRSPGDTLEVDIKPGKALLYVPFGADTEVVLEGLDHEIRNGRFVARLYLPGALPDGQRVKIPGRVRIIKEIPVLARRVSVGEEITEDDLRWIEIATDKIGRGVIQDGHALIGQSPRRSIRPGAPIRFRDVQRPILVTKGKLIKVVVQTPFMHISTTGKALDSGALGDTIRVLNTASHQIVQAIVDARNRAFVPTNSRTAAAR